MHTKKKKHTTTKIITSTVYETNSNIGLLPAALRFFFILLQGKTAMEPHWSSSQAATLPIKIDAIK